MISCQTCGTENLQSSQYCDECGSILKKVLKNQTRIEPIDFQHPPPEKKDFQAANVTSVGIPPISEERSSENSDIGDSEVSEELNKNAKLVIERGEAIGKKFNIRTEESYIGRWDADNGVFPDIDLDAHDKEAKVSRRHARIVWRSGNFMIEDLGSTNGTFVNRGRRLIPGEPHKLSSGDEIIVGKTFLRFVIDE